MIRFITMVRKSGGSCEVNISNDHELYIDIEDTHRKEEVRSIVKQGIHYGYIKVLINEVDPFVTYERQIIPLQWLRYIELFEELLEKQNVCTKDPNDIHLKKLDQDFLEFIVQEKVFILSYTNFINEFIDSAKKYFEIFTKYAQDSIYEDVIEHLVQLKNSLYEEKV